MRMREFCLLLTMAVTASCGSAAGVTASDAWSRPVPPVSPASAVFMEISNGTDASVILTGAESDACDGMELHETTFDEAGVMAMRPLIGGLPVASGETFLLAPGGVHLMCNAPAQQAGTFDVTLQLRDATDIVVTVAIEDR